MILTTGQYFTHKRGRNRLFERLQSLAYEFPFLFVGDSLNDPDLRAILLELTELNEAKPRSYILTPNMTPAEVRFWENKKISHIHMFFKDFLEELDTLIPTTFRVLSNFIDTKEHPITRRFNSDSGQPSESLMTFISRDAEYIHKDYKTSELDPQAFYRGYFDDLTPIVFNLDVNRSMSDDIMSEVFLATEGEKSERGEFYLIKGHAGSGKSVILRRLAWDAATEYDKLCLLLKQSAFPEYEPLSELHRLYKKRIFLFVDPVSDYIDKIEEFILEARKDKLPLTIIGAERHSEWNDNCEHLEAYLTDSYEVRYLSEKEISELINLLTRHKSLGYLEGMTFEQQREALSKKAGRQLLVALHEATLGKPFREIVLDEYNSISSTKAQSLYLTVCIFHRLGVPVRTGLISRVHGIPFTTFKEELFKPLEFIVFASMDKVIRDYVYRSRHPHIAEIVFEEVLTDHQNRYNEYMRILKAIDIDYNSDYEAFKGLTNAKQLLALFGDTQTIRQIYAAAEDRAGEHPKLMQQEAIFEMRAPDGSLNKATEILQRAYRLAPYDKTIAHSLSELARRKAQGAPTNLERNKYRQEAREISRRLVSNDPISSYPYHTLIKIGLDELAELIKQEDETVIEKKIKDVERLISRAEQAFPEDEYILDEEARFCKLLNQHSYALKALEKAFSSNKKSPYIALRLAKMYKANHEQKKAIKTLKECAELNPHDKDVNFSLAMLLSETPDASKADIIHHLRRSFTMGDSNHAAQFWYARFIYLEGDHSVASEIFNGLKDANVDSRVKQEPRGIVKKDGVAVKYSGVISTLEASYAFITRDSYQDGIFTHRKYSSPSEWSKLTHQGRVIFNLAFNYRGALALKVEQEKGEF